MRLKSQYNDAIKALKVLGVEQLVPSFEEIKQTMPKTQPKGTRLVITPAIGETLSFMELVARFDQKQAFESYIYRELWEKYDLSAPMKVSLAYEEPMFFNQTFSEQVQSVAKHKADSMTPAEYVMLSAIRRENNQEPLDKTTYRRFTCLNYMTVDGDSVVGRVGSNDGRLKLSWDFGGGAGSSSGVGLSVGLKPYSLVLTPSSKTNDCSSANKVLQTILDAEYKRGWNDALDNMPKRLN